MHKLYINYLENFIIIMKFNKKIIIVHPKILVDDSIQIAMCYNNKIVIICKNSISYIYDVTINITMNTKKFENTVTYEFTYEKGKIAMNIYSGDSYLYSLDDHLNVYILDDKKAKQFEENTFLNYLLYNNINLPISVDLSDNIFVHNFKNNIIFCNITKKYIYYKYEKTIRNVFVHKIISVDMEKISFINYEYKYKTIYIHPGFPIL